MKDALLEACRSAVKAAERLGASEAEAMASLTTTMEATLTPKGIEYFSSREAGWVGVRVVLGRRVAMAASAGLEAGSIEKAVERAFKAAKASSEDPHWSSLPTRLSATSVEGVFDGETAEVTPDAILDAFNPLTASVGGGVRLVEARLSTHVGQVAISNTYGGEVYRRGTAAYCGLEVIVEGEQSTGHEWDSSTSFRRLRLEQTGESAVEKAIKFRGAKPIETGALDVVLVNKEAASLIGLMVGPAVSALWVQESRSPLAGRIGEAVADEQLTIVDDGTMPAGLGTREFDDEGVPTRRNVVIEKGVLKTYLYDSYTAGREGRESTGNAHRAPWSRPEPSPNNLVVKAGSGGLEELVGDVKRGLVVYDTIGAWLSNPVNGWLNATVSQGMLVVNGEEVQPVKGVIISGNFWSIVREGLGGVGGDVEHAGSNYSPSLLLRNLTVAGH